MPLNLQRGASSLFFQPPLFIVAISDQHIALSLSNDHKLLNDLTILSESDHSTNQILIKPEGSSVKPQASMLPSIYAKSMVKNLKPQEIPGRYHTTHVFRTRKQVKAYNGTCSRLVPKQ